MTSPRPSVLLVDDIESNLTAIGAHLADLDCDVVSVTSGNDALRQLLKREFAVMLLDVQMPEMDGFEVARIARANPQTQGVPVIFVTAMHETYADAMRGYGAGAVDFLYKPLNPYVLRSKVQVFLELYVGKRKLADEVESHRKTTTEVEAFSALIGALDVQVMVDKVAALVVPRLADWCTISVVEPEAHSAAALSLDPVRLACVQQLERRPPPLGAPWGAGDVMRTGRAELYRELPTALLRHYARDEPELEVLRRLEIASTMIVPLPARGRIIGTIALRSCDPAHRYQPADLVLAEEIGRRAGLAADNIFLHAEAQEAIRARDEFLSIASHELRTPITTLQLQHDTLLRILLPTADPAVAPQVEKKLKTAIRQTERLGLLVDNLLDASRIMTDQLSIDARPLDLAALTTEIVGNFAEAFRRSGCELTTRIQPGVVGCWDSLRMEQVINNLLSNAVKFGAGKPIEVSVEQRPGAAVLTVSDHGIGIADEDLPRVFGRFERLVSSRHYGGLGLGLFIARRSVEAQGGTITVASKPGRGSTFVVSLPRERAEDDSAALRNAAVRSSSPPAFDSAHLR